MRTRSGVSYCDTASVNVAEKNSSERSGTQFRKKVGHQVRCEACRKCQKLQFELQRKDIELTEEKKARESVEHSLLELRDQVTQKLTPHDCQGCQNLKIQLQMKEAEFNGEIKLRELADCTIAKLNDQVHLLQKELDTEKSWGNHVKILINKLPPSLEVSKLESVNENIEATLLADIKKEIDMLKQSEISLKKEIECMKDSKAGLIEQNMYLQKVIASQEASFEDFRQWVEETFINKMSFTTFSSADIEEMIQSNNVIGSGGYGKVYRASVAGKEVAVKILDSNSDQGLREFDTEVTILKKVHHKNLIHLIGACPTKHALVYEFLGNGTLHERLYAKACLTWQQRITIAFDICSALVFLHSMKPNPVVHCDLKPDNIIFDADDVPKISDFGISYELSKLSETGTWHHMTIGTPRGTPVYIDPEFRGTKKVTPSADTHAFGMLLLQLITGQGSSNLVKFVVEQLERFEKVKQKASPLQKKVLRSLGLMDSHLGLDSWNPKAVVLLLKLGLACTHEDRKQRPSLSGHVWPQLYMIREESAFC